MAGGGASVIYADTVSGFNNFLLHSGYIITVHSLNVLLFPHEALICYFIILLGRRGRKTNSLRSLVKMN